MKNHQIIVVMLALGALITEVKSQVLGKWYIVTETMFNGLNLDTSKILITDYRTGMKETHPFLKTFDSFALDSFAGAIYNYSEGLIFYWINFDVKTKEQIIAAKEQAASSLLASLTPDLNINQSQKNGSSAGEMKLEDKKLNPSLLKTTSKALQDIIKRFCTDFIIKPTYAVDEKTKEVVGCWIGFRIDVKKEIVLCEKGDLVLRNDKTGQEFFIADSASGKSLNMLLRCVYRFDVQQGLENFLVINRKQGGIDKNVDFLESYFSLMLNKLPKIYPKFVPIPEGWYLGACDMMKKKDWCVPEDSKETLGERRITVNND